MNSDKIVISIDRYNELVKAETILDALYDYGVQDWEGYDIAMEYVEFVSE